MRRRNFAHALNNILGNIYSASRVKRHDILDMDKYSLPGTRITIG